MKKEMRKKLNLSRKTMIRLDNLEADRLLGGDTCIFQCTPHAICMTTPGTTTPLYPDMQDASEGNAPLCTNPYYTSLDGCQIPETFNC